MLPLQVGVALRADALPLSEPEGITATAALLQVTNLFLSFGSHTAFLPVLFEMKK